MQAIKHLSLLCIFIGFEFDYAIKKEDQTVIIDVADVFLFFFLEIENAKHSNRTKRFYLYVNT